MEKFSITTAIDYVNGEAHIGHAYEKIFTDVVFRHYKKRADKERKARLEKEGKGGDFKPEYEERDVEPAEIIVAKNRNGETKTIRIQFRKRFTRFENPETNETPHPETKLNVDEIRSIVGSF